MEGKKGTRYSKEMVKIVEVDEQPDANRDDECYEIDPAEFAKKVNLKETEDVVLVAAKGMIKVEVVELEDFAKTLGGHGCAATCSRFGGGVDHGNRHELATGDSIDNPYQIEDEPTLLQMEIVEDRFALDKSRREFGADACRTEVTYKIVVKCEPDDLDGVEGVGHDACNHCNEMNSEPGADDDKEEKFFHEDKDATDVSVKLLEKPSEPVDINNGVEVIPENLVGNCEPVDGDSVNGAEEDTYDHCPEMIPKRRIFDEDDAEDVVVI